MRNSVSLKNDAVYALLHVILTEIHKQSQMFVQQFKICSCLFEKNWFHLLYGFQFYDDLVFYKDVKPQLSLQFITFIYNRYLFLSFNFQASLYQFKAQSLFIDRFQKSWSQGIVNFKDSPTYLICYFV